MNKAFFIVLYPKKREKNKKIRKMERGKITIFWLKIFTSVDHNYNDAESWLEKVKKNVTSLSGQTFQNLTLGKFVHL